MLDPELVIKRMGYSVGYHTDLGSLSAKNKALKVAALIDKKSQLVHVSNEFNMNVQNFMLAHELGHLILHEQTNLHKDIRKMDKNTVKYLSNMSSTR